MTLVKDIEKLKKIDVSEFPSEPTTVGEGELASVIKGMIDYYENYIFPRKIEIIKMKYLDAMDRYFQMKKMGLSYRSNRVFPLIASIHDTFVSNLYEIDVMPRAIARNKTDKEATEQAQNFFDWAKELSELDDREAPIWSESALIGTSYGRSGFLSKKDVVKYMKKGVVKTSEVTINKPTVDHVSFFQLFYDCHGSDFYNTPRKAYRYIDSFKSVASKYSFLFKDEEEITKKKMTILKDAPFSTMDYTRIYNSKNYENAMCSVKTQKDYDDWTQRKIFEINYSENELVEVVEYWEDDKFVLFINGKIYYDDVSPYPFNSDPFHIIVHEKVPGSIQGIGIGDKLLDLQKQVNTVYCGVEDAMRMHLYPMYKVSKGAMKDAKGQTPKKITYIPEGVLEDASPTSNGGIDPIRFVDFNFIQAAKQYLQDLISQAYEISGVNSYTQGGQGKVERSAAGIAQRTAVTRTRLQGIISSLNKFHARLFNQWLAIAVTLFDDDFNVRVIDENGLEAWKEIDLESILNKFDVVAESEANRLATKELRATQAINALAQIASVNIDPITQLPIYDVQPLISSVMDKFDFGVGFAPLTKEQIMEKIAMLNEIKGAQQPQQPMPQEMPAEQLMQQQAPVEQQAPYGTATDAEQLQQMYSQAYQG